MKYGRDNGLSEGRIGYTIDADSGVVKKDDGKSFATMEFGWACEGDYIDSPVIMFVALTFFAFLLSRPNLP